MGLTCLSYLACEAAYHAMMTFNPRGGNLTADLRGEPHGNGNFGVKCSPWQKGHGISISPLEPGLRPFWDCRYKTDPHFPLQILQISLHLTVQQRPLFHQSILSAGSEPEPSFKLVLRHPKASALNQGKWFKQHQNIAGLEIVLHSKQVRSMNFSTKMFHFRPQFITNNCASLAPFTQKYQ